MAFVSYSLTCTNYGDSDKCRWFCGYKDCDPQPECYENKFLAELEGDKDDIS